MKTLCLRRRWRLRDCRMRPPPRRSIHVGQAALPKPAMTLPKPQIASKPDRIDECNRALAEEALSRAGPRGDLRQSRDRLPASAAAATHAERDFDAALALDPSQPEAWLNKAIVACSDRATAREALPLVEKALRLGTERAGAGLFRARASPMSDAAIMRAAYCDLQARAGAGARTGPMPASELQRYQVGQPLSRADRADVAPSVMDVGHRAAASGSTARCWSGEPASRCAPTWPWSRRRPRPGPAPSSGSAR